MMGENYYDTIVLSSMEIFIPTESASKLKSDMDGIVCTQNFFIR